jgi:threonyl-tRNA synthetase
MALPEKAAVEQTDYKPLENIVSSIVKEKQVFVRLTLSKEDL